MSRLISDILRPKQLDFQHLLVEWEKRAGNQGHDVRLLSDIRLRSKLAIEALGLDNEDTAPSELYFALQSKARDDNNWLTSFYDVVPTDSPEEVIQKILVWVEAVRSTTAWVCKTSVMKGLLAKNPPKTVMKTLGLRSVDSMLKRNNPAELLPLAYILESQQWSCKLKANFKNCKPSDFDERKVCIYLIDDERVQRLTKAGMHHSRTVTPCYETGSILLIPPKQRFNMDVLAITVSLLESIAEIRKHSAYYRTISVRKDFGKQFSAVCNFGIVGASEKLSHIGWNSVHRNMIGNELMFGRLEQPHLSRGDIDAPTATHVLSALDDRFQYWNDLDYVFFIKERQRPVSMHLVDVVTNASNRLSFSESVSGYGRSRLWDELWSRYLSHDPIAEQVVNQFLGDENI